MTNPPVLALIMYQYRPHLNIKYTSIVVVAHHPKKKFRCGAGIDQAYQYGP